MPRRTTKEGRIVLIYRMSSEAQPPALMRLKVEINSRKHFSVFGVEERELAVRARWFSGGAKVKTYQLDELLGTKLRALFRGRGDVFPRRWENANKGKSGYSPACDNDWKDGLCEKKKSPDEGRRATCGECPKRAFIAISDEEIAKHLRGDQVIGVRVSDTADPDDRTPWTRPPSGRTRRVVITGPLPPAVNAVLSQRLFIEKAGLPSPLLNQLMRLSAFQNPEFR